MSCRGSRGISGGGDSTGSAIPAVRATIELLWWEGCPSTPKALDDLRAAVAEQGLDPARVVVREVTTDDDAARERFVGSPTVRVDGEDLFPPGDDEPVGLTCRIYRR